MENEDDIKINDSDVIDSDLDDSLTKLSTPEFEAISSSEIIDILATSIKYDEANKLIIFLCMLSAFTEDSQLNIALNAPSSSGKTYLPLQISMFFPKENVLKLSTASPTAFYHEQGKYDKESNSIKVDLSRKVIVFLDQPNSHLLQRLRSLLSHDDKEIISKITDKSKSGANRTKTVVIKGFPSVIFCSANLRLDEQESTRFILLSPEIHDDKIKQGILERIKREADPVSYKNFIESDPKRKLLAERVKAIRDKNITEIKIQNPKLIKEKFFEGITTLKPRYQRDISRIISLAKSFALLNLWDREFKDGVLIASDSDINEAFALWYLIAESQELNLPPYLLDIYKQIIEPLYIEKNQDSLISTKQGITKQEVNKKHYHIYGRHLPDWQFRQEIIPLLETSGLISTEADPNDKRKMLIFPTT